MSQLNTAKEHLLTLILGCEGHQSEHAFKLAGAYQQLHYCSTYSSCGGASMLADPGTPVEEIAPQAACTVGTTEVTTSPEPEAKPEKPRRSRTKPEPAPAVTETPAEPVELEVVESAEPKAVTRDDIRAYFVANKSAEIKTKLASLLAQFNAKDLNAVPDDKLVEFHAAFTA